MTDPRHGPPTLDVCLRRPHLECDPAGGRIPRAVGRTHQTGRRKAFDRPTGAGRRPVGQEALNGYAPQFDNRIMIYERLP